MEIIFEPPKLSKNKRNGNSVFRITLKVPYAENNTVKQLGARWDKEKRTWYVVIDSTKSVTTFTRWIASPILA